jgi:hypothetical protein
MSAQPPAAEADAPAPKEAQREAPPAQTAKEKERPPQDEALLCTICHMPSCWR